MHGGTLLNSVVAEEPLGERIGAFVFWPMLILLLGVMAWALWKRTRQGAASRKDSGKTWTRPEDYREHHRVAWSEDPETFAPAPEHWPLAVAAVFGVCSGDPWDRLRFEKLENAQAGLQEAWGVRSRPQLLNLLHWILREGHRVEFQREVEQWSGMDQIAAAELEKRLRRDGTQDALERAWRLRQVRSNARGIRDTDFEAWDLVRAAMLCRAGHSLDWLSEEETLDTMRLLSAQLQRRYSSWEDLGEHFTRARWYWGSAAGLEAQQEDAHDLSRQQALLDPQRGPWPRVPWSQPIPESRVLLAEALVAEELVVEPSDDSPTPLAAIIDAAVEDALVKRISPELPGTELPETEQP